MCRWAFADRRLHCPRKQQLHTNSAYKDMSATLIKGPYDMKMSPSGKCRWGWSRRSTFFHFNGGNPVTHYTGLLAKEPISQMFWDNDNHLYAISSTAGELLVFTIETYHAPEGTRVAHATPGAQDIIVQPLK